MAPMARPFSKSISDTGLCAAILAGVPMPLVLVSADERIGIMNPAAVELFGSNGEGRHYVTVLRQPGLLAAVEQAFRDGSEVAARYVLTDVAREMTYRVRAVPVAHGGEGGILVSFEDVTDLERAGQMRRDFVANVSHELKTPLTALLGFIETLRGAARNDAAARDRFLAIMEREAERMNRLVSDLLSLSRVESSARQRPRDPVALDDLAQSTLNALRTLAEGEGVTLELERQGDGGVTVPGDADQLQQVLTNLVENAIKYGRDGGRVTVRVGRKARELAFRGPAVELVVEDYGEGFDPVHIPRLTERFYRVDTHRSRAVGGTGLGLAIAKHIVNRHRGRFRIESEPGKGARFTVVLPASE
ncbi:two-component system, OmpR family, phosphate regulon sensor histidine kinase PhoR [Tropicimonas isoalkanivorans]|uniref:histidine kinase n=2 Tax=Tropicimonas isoalkanivorans TaxID=441112 RepID=A0A1I1DF11_9RHOB|nr:two-component system, OmpR family, phosphate regulon sensor histidine kinase PhoR [Tropicimonas isoalkanivorans]